MRQTHDVVGGALKAMNDLADNLTALIIASYPPAAILTTLLGEAALAFPGLRDTDLMKLIDDLLCAAESKPMPYAKVIRLPQPHVRRAATVLVMIR